MRLRKKMALAKVTKTNMCLGQVSSPSLGLRKQSPCFWLCPGPSQSQGLYHWLLLQNGRRLGSLHVFPLLQAVCFCWQHMKMAWLLALQGDGLTQGVMWAVSTKTNGSEESVGHDPEKWPRKPHPMRVLCGFLMLFSALPARVPVMSGRLPESLDHPLRAE